MNKYDKNNYIYTSFTLLVSTVLWYVMFVIKPLNFWIEMSLSILLLVIMALYAKRNLLHFEKISVRHIMIGIISSVGLYFVFYFGNIIAGYLFPFKDAQVLSVYSNRSQGNPLFIGLLLLFIIGPGEELFWRGFIQNTLSEKIGENKGYILASLLYASVHIITGNFMLIIAALVCGAYWGFIYKKEKSLVPVIISHALWDFTIFILFPVI